jgi:DNA-binding transcriptional LysR family regulator
MMGRSGSSATIGAMLTACFGIAFAAQHAIQSGIQRGRDLRAVDDAHALGQAYYAKRVRQRRAAALSDAAAKKQRLLAGRKMLHG